MEKTFKWTVEEEFTMEELDFDVICRTYLVLKKRCGNLLTDGELWREALNRYIWGGEFDFDVGRVPQEIWLQIIAESKKFYEEVYKNA